MPQSGSRRTRRHNAASTRETILNAAKQVFAEHGFDGARVDTIAEVAGYNKSLLFQYFGDKLGLYLEVIRRIDSETRDIQTQAIAALPAGDIPLNYEMVAPPLKKFIGDVFDFYSEHPQIARILLWEMAEGWQTYEKIATQLDTSDLDRLRPILARLRDAGILHSDFDLGIQIVLVYLVSVVFLACVPLFQIFFPSEGLPSSEAMVRAREFVIEFSVRGLLSK